MAQAESEAIFRTVNLEGKVKYRWRMVYIRRILSHAEYDEKEWQK